MCVVKAGERGSQLGCSFLLIFYPSRSRRVELMIWISKMIRDETRISEKNKAADNFGRLTQSRLPQEFFKSNLDKHNDQLGVIPWKSRPVKSTRNWGWNTVTCVPVETNLFYPLNHWKGNQALRPVLFSNITFVGVGFLASHKGQTRWSVVRRSLRFSVLIREAKNIKPFAHVTRKVTKLAYSTQLFLAWGCLYLWANVVLTRL